MVPEGVPVDELAGVKGIAGGFDLDDAAGVRMSVQARVGRVES